LVLMSNVLPLCALVSDAFSTPQWSFAGYTSPKPMKWTPLRLVYSAATVSLVLALLPTEPAFAHVDVRPRLVELGTPTELRVELPLLRAGPAPVRLEVQGNGVTVLASGLHAVAGSETQWNVRIRVSPTVPPGDLPLVLRAVFADGESVKVDSTITVVPPATEPSDGAFPWLGVVVGVTAAVALGIGGLVLARRRTT
jgi:hypothetical protein